MLLIEADIENNNYVGRRLWSDGATYSLSMQGMAVQQRGSGAGSVGTGGESSGERGMHVDSEYIVEISDHSSSSSESQTFYEDDFSTSDDSSADEGKRVTEGE